MSNTTSVDNPILAARKISPLRQRMIDDMTVRNFAPNTILCYLKQVSYFLSILANHRTTYMKFEKRIRALEACMTTDGTR